ncbi:MAG: hypothetical protein RLZZ175_3055 [Bacteroidota bacterium]|jgi:hypothetical protein
MSNFNEEKVVNALIEYLKPLTNEYNWLNNNLINSIQLLIPELEKSINDYTIKHEISKFLKIYKSSENEEQFIKVANWIVSEWGGISNSKEENTTQLLKKIFSNIDKPLKSLSFTRIASTSKIYAFFNPLDYAIYDSRVAISINWILLKNGFIDNFFPIPEGRNPKLAKVDINVLIYLKSIKSGIKEDTLYLPKKETYIKYINVLKEVNKRLFENEKENIILTEMLLFSIADKDIYQDIVNSVSLKIN